MCLFPPLPDSLPAGEVPRALQDIQLRKTANKTGCVSLVSRFSALETPGPRLTLFPARLLPLLGLSSYVDQILPTYLNPPHPRNLFCCPNSGRATSHSV